jgi:glycosyltransferase involved in cell wall biosynthesis
MPDGGAAARRILGNAKTLEASGFEVLIGSGQQTPTDRTNPLDFEGIPVFSLAERDAEHLPTLLKHLLYLRMGRKTVAWLEALLPRPRAVILYSGYSPYFLRLLPWCKRNAIPLIFDAVEWYDPGNIPGGRYGPYRWNIELAMRNLCLRCGNILAISSYLENYYGSRGCTTVRIPPTLDVQSLPSPSTLSQGGRLILGYTGTPGKKDLFNNILEGILQVDPKGDRVLFRIAGITQAQLLAFPALSERGFRTPPPSLIALGRIPHKEAQSLIREAHFSVLLRPQERYAQAGFPTKVVESLSMGTPVLCNLTSDLELYIQDGEEGILCSDHTPEAFARVLQRTLSLPHEKLQDMKMKARKRAETAFDFRIFAAPLKRFIENAKVG